MLATTTDRDGDGFRPPADCNDADAAVKPGATEVFGNAVDEDCSGRADPLQTIDAFVQTSFRTRARSTKVLRLRARNVEGGTRVRASCRGGSRRGCKVARRDIAVDATARTLDLRKPLRLGSLKPGAVVEVAFLRADSIGEVTRWTYRRGKLPSIVTSCLQPDGTTKVRCP